MCPISLTARLPRLAAQGSMLIPLARHLVRAQCHNQRDTKPNRVLLLERLLCRPTNSPLSLVAGKQVTEDGCTV